MKKTITLGREGDQPFSIKQSGVSNTHARLTIEGDNWTLEDLESTNGTFVIDPSGVLTQVGRLQISPRTLVCLGPNNANGCTFYAYLAVQGVDYSEAFNYLEETDERLREQEEQADVTAKNVRKAIAAVSIVALAGSFVVPGDDLRMLLLRIGTLVSALSAMFYDPAKRKLQLKQMREKFFKCPNPECSHTLTAKEIQNRRCSKCKAQG